VIYDTAGRLAVDEVLMTELAEIKSKAEPENIFLVVEAMIGQDAVKTARSFHERLAISGVILTKLDGDACGGAALSIKEVTGVPILFSGVGETADKFEEGIGIIGTWRPQPRPEPEPSRPRAPRRASCR
jgi:signal recognition particle subunit SRP54